MKKAKQSKKPLSQTPKTPPSPAKSPPPPATPPPPLAAGAEYAPLKKGTLLGSKQMLGVAWNAYKANWQSFAGLILLMYASFIVPVFLLLAAGGFGVVLVRDITESGSLSVIITLILVILAIIAIIALFIWILLVSYSLITLIIHAEERIGVANAIKITGKKLKSLVWIIILYTVIVSIGYLLFIIPGIILTIYYSFAFYVYLKEDIHGYAALKRSREIVRGYEWTFLRRWVFLLYVAGAIGIFSLIPIIGWLGNLIAPFIINPLFGIFFFVLYLNIVDQKIRGNETDNTTTRQKLITLLLAIVPAVVFFIGITIATVVGVISSDEDRTSPLRDQIEAPFEDFYPPETVPLG